MLDANDPDADLELEQLDICSQRWNIEQHNDNLDGKPYRMIAYNRAGLPAQPLYRVRFLQQDLWDDYAGASRDSLDVDVYQHWLDKG